MKKNFMDWNYIISFMGGSVAFFGAAAWLTRVLVTQLMLKNIESYKAQLLSEYNLALEKFKSDLQNKCRTSSNIQRAS